MLQVSQKIAERPKRCLGAQNKNHSVYLFSESQRCRDAKFWWRFWRARSVQKSTRIQRLSLGVFLEILEIPEILCNDTLVRSQTLSVNRSLWAFSPKAKFRLYAFADMTENAAKIWQSFHRFSSFNLQGKWLQEISQHKSGEDAPRVSSR